MELLIRTDSFLMLYGAVTDGIPYQSYLKEAGQNPSRLRK